MIKDKRVEELYLIPASGTRDKDALSVDGMRELVRKLVEEEGITRVILDSPAGIEAGFKTAAAPANAALVVVNPESSSIRDADRIIGLLEPQGISEVKLVINRMRPHMVKKEEMLSVDDVVGLLGAKPVGIIPEDENILISTNKGTPIILDTSTKAGAAFWDTARRIHGEDVAFAALEEKKGWLARLFGGR
jgi:septum site-determining protein MinD